MVESMVKGQISVQLEYTFTWPQGPSHVEIGGDFGLADTPSWALIPLDWDEHDCCFKKTLYLSVPRNLLFKFVVDGNWVCRPDIETRMDSSGNLNNFISLDYPLQKDFLKVPSQNHENHIEERVNALNNHPDVAVVAKADLNSSSAATNPTVEVISNIRKSEASDLSILTNFSPPKLKACINELNDNKKADGCEALELSIQACAQDTVNRGSKELIKTCENAEFETYCNGFSLASSLENNKKSKFSPIVTSNNSSHNDSMQTKPMDCYNTTFNQPSHETQLDLKAAHHLNAEMKVPHFVASEETLDLAIKAGFELEFISDISPKSIGCSAASNKPQNDEMVASQSIQKSGDRVKQVPCNFAKHISQSKDTVKLDPSCAYGIMISKEIFFKDNYQFMAKFI